MLWKAIWKFLTKLKIELFTTTKLWTLLKCPFTDEQIKKMRYLYTTVCIYDSALKREEILQYETAWMKLEVLMLNEISTSVKEKC